MEPLARLDSKSILSEEIFLEIFDQEDEIVKARMILSLTDRAGELGVKKKFEELLKAYKRVDKEAKQRERKKPSSMMRCCIKIGKLQVKSRKPELSRFVQIPPE